MIRNLKFDDLPWIERWCPSEFPLPDLASGLYCSQKALISRGNLAGAALLKLTCEAVLIINPSLGSLEKARLIKDSFAELKSEATQKYGLDQVHVFIVPDSNEHYAEFLMKHFQFKRASGIPLVYTR